jgi:hypothetical protein
MEEMNFEFVTLNLPNIQSKFRKDKKRPESVHIEPTLQPFVLELAAKHPQLRFVCQRHWTMADPQTKEEYSQAGDFKIYSSKELLGEISTDSGRNGVKVFTLGNERIAQSRTRGSLAKTKDLNKALKIFDKMFKTKTLHERLNEVLANVSQTVATVHTDRHYEFSESYKEIAKSLQDHVVENLDTLTAIALAAGAPKEAIEKLPSLHAECKITKEISSCLQKKLGDVVLIHGSDYAVTNIDETNRETKLYSTDTLPLHIKQGVGMLKLVEDKHFISGVGVKLNSVSFFIIPVGATNG